MTWLTRSASATDSPARSTTCCESSVESIPRGIPAAKLPSAWSSAHLMSLAWLIVCKTGVWSGAPGGVNDQRQAIARITAKGLRRLETIQPELEAQTDAQLRKLSDKDCHELSRLCALIFEDQADCGGKPHNS